MVALSGSITGWLRRGREPGLVIAVGQADSGGESPRALA